MFLKYYVYTMVKITDTVSKDEHPFWRSRQTLSLNRIESVRPSCDISDDVFGYFRLGRDWFHRSCHDVFDVTL